MLLGGLLGQRRILCSDGAQPELAAELDNPLMLDVHHAALAPSAILRRCAMDADNHVAPAHALAARVQPSPTMAAGVGADDRVHASAAQPVLPGWWRGLARWRPRATRYRPARWRYPGRPSLLPD